MNKLGKGILAKEKYSKFFKVDHGLVTLKMALFAYYGGVACLVPYLTIHMRQIGIDVEQTAIIYAVLPFTTFIGPPLAGFFADRLGRYQVILIMSLFGSAAFHTALLAVAEYQTITKPPLTEFLVSDIISVSVEKCPGQDLPLELAGKNIRWELENCASTCGNGDVPTEYPNGYNISILEYNSTLVLQNNSKSGFYLYRNSNTTAFEEVHGDPIPPCGLNCSANISIYDTEAQTYLPLMCTWKFGNKWFTFGMYFAIRIFSSVFLSISFSLLDATCFALVKEHNSDYGKQKLWSVIATAIFSPITGILIDHVALVTGITDFSPAFYMFDFFVVITVFITFKLECEFENPTDNMIKNVTDLLKSAEVNIFMMIIIVIGCMWGFVETFLYWYMLDLGSPKYLLGLTMTVGSGISIPFMFSSENIVKKIGFVNVLVCSLIFYGVRFVGYSMIYNPWWSLMFEAMEVITLHLMWVSAATYGAHLCPKGLLATMQGAMGGLHHGIGRGLGSFIGGTLITNTGARQSFRIMGVASAVIGIVYLVVYLTYIRKKQGNESKTCETIEMNEAEIKAFKKLAEIEESFVPAKMFGLEYSLSKRSLDSLPECTFTTKEVTFHAGNNIQFS